MSFTIAFPRVSATGRVHTSGRVPVSGRVSTLNRISLWVSYLVKDIFTTNRSAGAVNGTLAEPKGGSRTVTDTNNKLSISAGVLNFATGGVTAGNPGLWYPFMARVLGTIFLATVTPADTNGALAVGFDNAQVSGMRSGIVFNAAGSLRILVGANASLPALGLTYTGATTYECAVIARVIGCFYFIKGGIFSNWTLLWSSATDADSLFPSAVSNLNAATIGTVTNIRVPQVTNFIPVPSASDSFVRANGAIGTTDGLATPEANGGSGQIWNGVTWAILTNAAINTPVLGTELITNGSFTTDTAGWTAVSSVLSSIAGGQTGNCLQVANNAVAFGYAVQQITTVIGTKYHVAVYEKDGTTSGLFRIGTSSGGNQLLNSSFSNANWTQNFSTFVATTTTSFIRMGNAVNTSGVTVLWDDISVKALTASETFASLRENQSNDIHVAVNVTMSTGTQAGIVTNLDDQINPQNFVIAYHDGVTAKLDKCVNGVYSNLISATTTYVAGATIRVAKLGTTYTLFYNNLLVGSASVISNSSIINNKIHGLFSTYSGNSFINLIIRPTGTGGEYNQLNAY